MSGGTCVDPATRAGDSTHPGPPQRTETTGGAAVGSKIQVEVLALPHRPGGDNRTEIPAQGEAPPG